jgi:hypothetical protein
MCQSAATQTSPRSTAVIRATFQFQCVSGNSQLDAFAVLERDFMLPIMVCNFRVMPGVLRQNALLLAVMQIRTDLLNAPSMRHYILHNFEGGTDFVTAVLSPRLTQIPSFSYQGSENYRNFTRTPVFTLATANFADY